VKFSENWVKEWVQVDVSTSELTHQLTMAGLEVDGVEPVVPDFTGVVVGEVRSVDAHSNADALQVCAVDVGESEHLQIVCGAKNVTLGMKVPTAKVGAKLPGNFKIKKAKLRGVPSFGMLCAATELGLAEQSEGLLVLPNDAPIGQDVRDYLMLNDVSIDVDLTPNRGDCLSVRGIARELGVLYQKPVVEPEMQICTAISEALFPVEVRVPESCPRYLGRVIRQVNPDAVTPMWMQEKLRRSGVRSLGALVDITNYVLLELGQPMHAFDLGKLEAKLTVRMASDGEQVTLLDGQEKVLSPSALVIADEQGPVALAGIMGGARTAVDSQTQHIFLECAYFSPLAIVGKGREYGIQTDSSHRFERGVDWQLQEQAMHRASALIQSIVGGEFGPILDITASEYLPQMSTIILQRQTLDQMLGVSIAPERVTDMLNRLGLAVEASDEGWQVVAPSYRFDLQIEADLVEEVARIYGYDNLPTSQIHTPLSLHAVPETEVSLGDMKQVLVGRGFQEAITYSFVHPDIQQCVEPELTEIVVANPLSQDLSVMRTGLWAGLLETMLYNRKRQQTRIRLFESGLRFIEVKGEIQQDNRLAGLITGGVQSEQWHEKMRHVDFFDMKADVSSVLSLVDGADAFMFKKETHPALHPGQSARIYRHNRAIGWVGMIHPKLEQQLGLGQTVFVFDLCVAEISQSPLPKYQPLSKYPSIRRDISIIVNEAITFEQVSLTIKNIQNPDLKETILFDVYRGQNLGSGQKSLAIGLILQNEAQTLTDETVDTITQAVVKMLSDKLGATLRD